MDKRPAKDPDGSSDLKILADRILHYLCQCFPVCCGSDEFYFFPQVFSEDPDWKAWDDFTPDRIHEVESTLNRFETDLTVLKGRTTDLNTLVDIDTIKRVSKTLREQLTLVRFQTDQPTFYLTVASTGLASALESPDDGAWPERVKHLSSFFSDARSVLVNSPSLFRDMGIAMVRDISSWLASLEGRTADISLALKSLEDFGGFLKNMTTRDSFLLAPELIEVIIKDHIGCGADISEVRQLIEEEIEETEKIMTFEAKKISPGSTWEEVLENLTRPPIPDDGPIALYRREVDNLLEHCLKKGLLSSSFARLYPLKVSYVPPYLAEIRAASAYSFSPEGSTPGGTFFIVPPGDSWENDREDLIDYRMLTAHETYPGHHLLDAKRWINDRPLRRPIEMPLFYEGWACFAEELMRQTGYFYKPEDLLLLAKRRYRRALRGLVDLDLQTGKLDIQAAGSFLVRSGFKEGPAMAVAPKYALRPGYQVCYTLGLRRFIDLYSRYGTGDPRSFSRNVLSRGEVSFDHLEKLLNEEKHPGDRGSGPD